MKTKIPWASIEEQKQYWKDKEAASNNATNETGEVKAITEALWQYHRALDTHQHGGLAAGDFVSAVETILSKPWIRNATISASSNPKPEPTTTANSKPETSLTLDQTESATQFYDDLEQRDVDRGDLRDDGRSFGYGMSYSERNA